MLEGVRSASEFSNMSFPDTSLAEGGVLHRRSRWMIAGDPGVGKSYMALQMGYEASLGVPLLGIWKVVKPLRVLYVQVEVAEPLLHIRYMRLRGDEPDPDKLFLKTDEEFILADNAMELSETIEADNIELVILDPLYLMHTGDENAVHTIRPTQRIVDQLRRKHGVTFIIIHHLRKTQPGERPSMNMLRGSSGWVGWVDTIALAVAGGAEDEVKLHLLKARNRQEGLPRDAYVLNWTDSGKFFEFVGTEETGSLSLVLDAIDEVGTDGRAKLGNVVAWLGETGGTGWSRSACYRKIRELERRGLAVRDGMDLVVGQDIV